MPITTQFTCNTPLKVSNTSFELHNIYFLSQPQLWAHDQGKGGCKGAGKEEAWESHHIFLGV
jgi:hypothetical protein